MHAIVDLNGKQYQVEEGRYLLVDRLQHDQDATIELKNVLMVVNGEDTLVGAPYVEGAIAKARVLGHERGAKIMVYKMRCKKGYRRKNGYRHDYTRLQIEGLEFPGKPAGAAVATPETEEKPKKKAPAKKKAEGEAADKPKKAAPKAKKEESAKAEAETQTGNEE